MITLAILGIACFLFLVFEQYFFSKNWFKGLFVSVGFEKSEMFVNDSSYLVEVIENRKHSTVPMLKVKFECDRAMSFCDESGSRTTDKYYRNDIFSITGNERITRRITFFAKKRGHYSIDTTDIVGSDMLLLAEKSKSLTNKANIVIFPRMIKRAGDFCILNLLFGEYMSKNALYEDPFCFEGIREYSPRDSYKNINWKASGKSDLLYVNRFSKTAHVNVNIYLNTNDSGILKKEDSVEASISLAAGLCYESLKKGYCVSLNSFVKINPGTGMEHLYTILRALAFVDTNKGWDFVNEYQEKLLEEDDNSLIFIIGHDEYEKTLHFYKKLSLNGKRFMWLYPYFDARELKSNAVVSNGLLSCIQYINMSEVEYYDTEKFR